MARYYVRGRFEKGSTHSVTDTTVEADSERTAIELAKEKAYKFSPTKRDWTWRVTSVERK